MSELSMSGSSGRDGTPLRRDISSRGAGANKPTSTVFWDYSRLNAVNAYLLIPFRGWRDILWLCWDRKGRQASCNGTEKTNTMIVIGKEGQVDWL